MATNSHEFYETYCDRFNCSVEMIYIAPVLQYNRQLLRYEYENRVFRYYTLVNGSVVMYAGLLPEWKTRTSITCIGHDGETYRIVHAGELNSAGLDAYIQRNKLDHRFAKFLCTEYGARISAKKIRHKVVW